MGQFQLMTGTGCDHRSGQLKGQEEKVLGEGSLEAGGQVLSVGALRLPFLGQRKTTDQCQIVESILSRARASDWSQ